MQKVLFAVEAVSLSLFLSSTLVLQNTTSALTLCGNGEREFRSRRGPGAGACSQRVLCSGNMGVSSFAGCVAQRRCK